MSGWDEEDRNVWSSGGWSSGFTLNPSVKLSDCRELVIVPKGPDYVMKELDDKFPDYCWKYTGTGAIAQYHFDLASKQASSSSCDTAPSRQVKPSLPVFYATIPHFYSPTEFSVQPKYLDKNRAKMELSLRDIYTTEKNGIPEFHADQLVVGVACAVETDEGVWARGRLRQMAGTANALVELVDFGTVRITEVRHMRWLVKRFGKVPPMALPCRIKEVYINDLDVKKVDEFQALIESCKRTVRVELTNTEEPYVVNLYHPTVEGENLGRVFYRREQCQAREAAKDRKMKDHYRRMKNEDDDDFEKNEEFLSDSESSSDVDDLPEQLFVYSLDRCPKAARASHLPLHVGHIENCRFISLHDEFMVKERARLEEKLRNEFDKLPTIPPAWLSPGVSCCLRFGDSASSVRRATIEEVTEEWVEVVFCDYGEWMLIPIAEVKSRLRLLTEEFNVAPLVYLVTLSDYFHVFPHETVTEMLRDILGKDKMARFVVDRNHRQSKPLRGTLFTNGGVDVQEELERRLELRGVDIECRDIVLCNLSSRTSFAKMDPQFKYRLFPPSSLMKGTLELKALP